MNAYIWRKNFIGTVTEGSNTIRGKMAFKTKEIQWLETDKPIIILVSIHSAFHTGIDGDLKMNAFISTIKNHVKGKITILLSEKAHLQTLSLDHQGNLEITFAECLNDANVLNDRYQEYFKGCDVVYWHSYINAHECYLSSIELLKKTYQNDLVFQKHLHADAENVYTSDRMHKYPNKFLFIEKTVDDLLEQCACLMVLSEKKYSFQFYPGIPYRSVEYVNNVLIPEDKRTDWISVYLNVEKKTFNPTTLG